jgi:hypothetical protein
MQNKKDATMAHVDTCGFSTMSNEIPCHWFLEKLSNIILRKAINFLTIWISFETYCTPIAINKRHKQVWDDVLYQHKGQAQEIWLPYESYVLLNAFS